MNFLLAAALLSVLAVAPLRAVAVEPDAAREGREQRKADLRAALQSQRAGNEVAQGHRLSPQQRVELRQQLKSPQQPAHAGGKP